MNDESMNDERKNVQEMTREELLSEVREAGCETSIVEAMTGREESLDTCDIRVLRDVVAALRKADDMGLLHGNPPGGFVAAGLLDEKTGLTYSEDEAVERLFEHFGDDSANGEAAIFAEIGHIHHCITGSPRPALSVLTEMMAASRRLSVCCDDLVREAAKDPHGQKHKEKATDLGLLVTTEIDAGMMHILGRLLKVGVMTYLVSHGRLAVEARVRKAEGKSSEGTS